MYKSINVVTTFKYFTQPTYAVGNTLPSSVAYFKFDNRFDARYKTQGNFIIMYKYIITK